MNRLVLVITLKNQIVFFHQAFMLSNLSVHKIQYHHDHKHMHRIEGVAGVLKGLAVVALTATVESDWDQCEEGEALLAQLDFGTEDGYGIHQTTEELDIDPIQGEELAQEAPPLPATE